MKQISILIACLALAIGSCKKSDDGGSGKIAGGSFTIGSQSYDVTSSARVTTGSNVIMYTFTSFNSSTFANSTVNFYFAGNTTPAAGTYNVVNVAGPLAANQVGFSASQYVSSLISYLPSGSGTASVTVDNDKITIHMNTINVSADPGSPTTISAAVGEK